MSDALPLRVVQWATGNIGTKSLRGVIEHPAMVLVGLYVHTAAKVGVDAGELCGLSATGVLATNSIDEIVALDADCVLYMQQFCDFDLVARLLASGKNVVTTRGEFHHPQSMDPARRAQIEDACRDGAASIHSTGSSPGFITEALPLVLSSIQRRVDSVIIDEFADLSQRNSPGLLFDVMGFGRAPAAYDPRRLSHGKISFGPSLQVVADALGLPLDSIEAGGAFAVASRDVEIAAGPIAAGTVAAQQLTVSGMHDCRALLQFRATWYCATEIDADWSLRETGWRVTVAGDAPLAIDIMFPVPLESLGSVTPGYTANRAVNAVPYVCAAPPGIVRSTDLPQVIANLR